MLPDGDYSPIISIGIDGQQRKFLLDTGGFWSLISPNVITAYKPVTAPVLGRLGLQGLRRLASVEVRAVIEVRRIGDLLAGRRCYRSQGQSFRR